MEIILTKVILKMFVFIKFVVLLTIVNDDPSLTVVNKERMREEIERASVLIIY